ncbi:MAG: LiaI-LiaF-like domain-containing protein [Actinomycetota bacterium]
MADPGPSRTALVAGVAFVLAGVAFLLEQLDVWDLDLRTLAPAALIGVGLAILIGGRSGRGR